MSSRAQSSSTIATEETVKVKIRYFGPVIAILQRKSDEVSLQKGRTKVSDLINELCLRYGDEFREIAIHEGTINSGLVVFVNGESVLDPTQELIESDQIQILIASQMKGG